MAIFKRFMNVVKSNLNHLIKKVENPEKMLNQMLLDMDKQLILTRKQVALAISDEKRLAAQYKSEKHLAKSWEKKALIAIKAGDDNLASQALEKQNEHLDLSKKFQAQLEAQSKSVDSLKKGLKISAYKLNDTRRQKNLLIARARRAEAQISISETISGFSQHNTSDALNSIQETIDKLDSEAQAANDLMDDDINHNYLSLEIDKLQTFDSENALANLKKKAGLVPSPDYSKIQEKIKPEKNKSKILNKIKNQVEKEIHTDSNSINYP